MFERFGRDLARFFALDSRDGNPALFEKVRMALTEPKVHAIAVYRFGSWITQNVKFRPARVPLRAAYLTVDWATRVMWGIHIDQRADIGGGLYLGHTGPILVGPVRMGADCSISANVTIGRRAERDGLNGLPTFGDRVWIGAGSVVFGGINIGSGTSIAPVTAVGRSIAPRTLVSGSPMQILRKDYDNSAQIYGQNPPPEAAPSDRGQPVSTPRPLAKSLKWETDLPEALKVTPLDGTAALKR